VFAAINRLVFGLVMYYCQVKNAGTLSPGGVEDVIIIDMNLVDFSATGLQRWEYARMKVVS